MDNANKQKTIEQIYGMIDSLQDMPPSVVDQVYHYLGNILWF